MSNSRQMTEKANAQTAHIRVHGRRKHKQVLSRFVFASALCVSLAAIVAFSVVQLGRSGSSNGAQLDNSNDVGIGTVVRQTNREQCELVKFDNYTGRTIENSGHCENMVVQDARGVPIPLGTIHRLDSISRSFLGNNR